MRKPDANVREFVASLLKLAPHDAAAKLLTSIGDEAIKRNVEFPSLLSGLAMAFEGEFAKTAVNGALKSIFDTAHPPTPEIAESMGLVRDHNKEHSLEPPASEAAAEDAAERAAEAKPAAKGGKGKKGPASEG